MTLHFNTKGNESERRALGRVRLASVVPALGLRSRSGRRGSAVLIVLLLLAMIGTLVISNAVNLRRLKVELQLLEERQNRRLSQPSGVE